MEKFVSFVAVISYLWLYRDFVPQGEEKFGSLKREFVISGVRYMEGRVWFVISGVRNIESSLHI